ncbi:Nucleoporin NUP84 [Wickerhamiella sorbophila]|uniref:Nuclear pore complex protein n=1 Tax=Wickerhamiella sorbophila TaxID=45607 RepID=A0A2T0FCT4_9ASCO|nr:Nucleoporin NUP84 [Wickerhamiella sorbophila]PRT52814.1 Nucleoporin NUP84 [Wickerhamiella sorbophila]
MEVDEFAEAVQRTDNGAVLAEAFQEAVRKQAVQVNQQQGAENPEFIALEREARLWSLVQTVQASINHTESGRHSQVLAWLMEMQITPAEPSDFTATKWLHTTTQVRAGQGGSIRMLDLDAPVREGAAIDASDAEADATVFNYIFDLLLAGKRKKAARVCSSTNNWQLKALLEAQITALTAATCFAVSTTSNITIAERAVYGFLAGDVQSALPLCTTWEQQFIVMLNSLVCSERFSSEKIKLALPVCPYKSFDDVFAALAKLPLSNEFIYRVMGAVISDKIGELEAEVAKEINLLASAPDTVSADPSYVRIAAHLALVAPQGVAAKDSELVIDAYISYLEMLEKWHWIPGYVRFLPKQAMAEVYGRVLAQIAAAPQRQLQLQIASKFDLPIKESIKTAANLILQQNSDMFVEDDVHDEIETEQVGQHAQQLIAAIEWLREAQLWDSTAETVAVVADALLRHGEIAALRRLSDVTGLDDVAQQATGISPNLKADLEHYAVLIQAFDAIARWEAVEHPTPEQATTVAEATQRAATILGPEASKASRQASLWIKYVPILILEAIRILDAANLYEKSLEMAVVVAEENSKLYNVFVASNRLSDLLDSLARAELNKW